MWRQVLELSKKEFSLNFFACLNETWSLNYLIGDERTGERTARDFKARWKSVNVQKTAHSQVIWASLR